MLVFVLITTALALAASSEGVQIQSCECSMCSCAAVSPEVVEEIPEEEICPGWNKYDGNCYKLIKESKSFHDASQRCKDLDGQLVSIHTEKENNFVFTLPGMNTVKAVSTQSVSIKSLNFHEVANGLEND